MREMEDRLLLAKRRRLVGFIYAFAVLWGIRAAFQPQGVEPLIASMATGVFMTWFCRTDSRIRGKPLAWSLQWVIYLTWPVFVPVYLLATRRLKRLHWVILAVAGYVLALCVPLFIVQFIVLGV